MGSVDVPRRGGTPERREGVQDAVVLDANDYIIVTSREGRKHTLTGPAVYVPTYGDSWTCTAECVSVPINCYIVVEDTSNHDQPLRHVRGPCKHYNEPFERVIAPPGRSDVLRECYPVNSMSALWVQRTDGHIREWGGGGEEPEPAWLPARLPIADTPPCRPRPIRCGHQWPHPCCVGGRGCRCCSNRGGRQPPERHIRGASPLCSSSSGIGRPH